MFLFHLETILKSQDNDFSTAFLKLITFRIDNMRIKEDVTTKLSLVQKCNNNLIYSNMRYLSMIQIPKCKKGT